jgi:hypothetical protein
LPVDAHGDCLAHKFIVERRVDVGHADVENIQRRTFEKLQVRVTGDRLEIIRARIVDTINRAGLQLEQTRG